MDLAVMFTGGKDSCLALWYAIHQGWNITTLITVVSENPESYMFHHPNIKWTRIQAEALGIPHQTIPTAGLKEAEVQDLEAGLAKIRDSHPIQGVLTGAISSDYQKARFDRVCEELGLYNFSPLWRKEPMKLLREEVEQGFQILITACMAEGFDESWLGRRIDEEAIEELESISIKYGVNPAFEGGEAETFVTDGPIFKKRLEVVRSERIWKGGFGVYLLEEVELKDK